MVEEERRGEERGEETRVARNFSKQMAQTIMRSQTSTELHCQHTHTRARARARARERERTRDEFELTPFLRIECSLALLAARLASASAASPAPSPPPLFQDCVAEARRNFFFDHKRPIKGCRGCQGTGGRSGGQAALLTRRASERGRVGGPAKLKYLTSRRGVDWMGSGCLTL